MRCSCLCGWAIDLFPNPLVFWYRRPRVFLAINILLPLYLNYRYASTPREYFIYGVGPYFGFGLVSVIHILTLKSDFMRTYYQEFDPKRRRYLATMAAITSFFANKECEYLSDG